MASLSIKSTAPVHTLQTKTEAQKPAAQAAPEQKKKWLLIA